MPSIATQTPESDSPEDPPATKTNAPEENPNGVIDYSQFETILEKILKRFWSAITPNTTQVEFWAIYQKEAEAFDKDYSKKCDQDLDTTLIFVRAPLSKLWHLLKRALWAGLFSAVTSAFILDIQGDLKPDYAEKTAALILVLIQQVKDMASGSGSDIQLPTPFTPDPAIVTVQAMLYASLASSLFAAFFAVLGKQWVNRYMTRKGGSQMERNHDRQEKLDGMNQWYFPIAMEALPLMLQAALLLFGCALSRYLWTINHVVATVNLVFTALGAFLYVVMFIFATLSYACPYQTPFSIAALWILDFDRKHDKYIPRCAKFVLLTWDRLSVGTLNVYRWVKDLLKTLFHAEATLPTSSLNAPHELVETRAAENPVKAPRRIPKRKAEMKPDEMNAASVAWILNHSTDEAVIQAALEYVTEIVWYPHIDMPRPPTDHAHNAVSECFDGSGNLIPGLRNKACTSLKALGICVIQEKIRAASHLLSAYNLEQIGRLRDRDDGPDRSLGSLTSLYNEGFTDPWAIQYLDASIDAGVSPFHLSWASQFLIQYMLWQVAQSSHSSIDDVPDDFFDIAGTCLHRFPPPAVAHVIAAVGLIVGGPSRVEDLILETRKKSKSLDEVIAWALARLRKTSQAEIASISPLVKQSGAVERVLEVLEILTDNPHHPRESTHWPLAIQSLRNVLSDVLSSSVADSDKWKISSLVLKLEYKMGRGGWEIDDHYLECLLELLERQVHLPLDSSPDEFEETLLHILRALFRSDKTRIIWNDQLYDNLRFALGAGRSPEVRKEALKVISAFSQYIGDTELLVKLCVELFPMLQEFLERQVHLPVDPSPDEYEETLLHILRALSRSGRESIAWNDQFVDNLRFALGAGRSPEVRKEAFQVIYAFSFHIPSTKDKELLVNICREVSSILREFWSSLASESKSECALDYSRAIYRIAGAPASHPFLFRDQWNAVAEIPVLKGSLGLLGSIAKEIGSSLPELIAAEQNREATRAWLELARKSAYGLRYAVLQRIEAAAAEVLKTEETEDSVDGDQPTASGDLDPL